MMVLKLKYSFLDDSGEFILFANNNKTKVERAQLGCLLKSSIFVVQKAATPKNGLEFCQWSIDALRCSLITTTGGVGRVCVVVVGVQTYFIVQLKPKPK